MNEYDIKDKEQYTYDSANVPKHRRSERRKGVKKLQSVDDRPKCGLACLSSKDVEIHRKTHQICGRTHQLKPLYVCPECHKAFKYKASFNTHRRQHESKLSTPYKCGSCQQHFVKAQTLKQHLQQAHPDGFRTCACTACGRKFKELALLSTHLKKFCKKSLPHPCEECPGTSQSQAGSVLKAHADALSSKVPNTGRKQHKDVCNEINTEAPQGVNSEEKDRGVGDPHATEPPCPPPKRRRGRPPKSESQKEAGPSKGRRKECDPVKCPQCGTKVSRARDLKIHMRVHTGEMPYVCRDCRKPFRHRASYNLHIKQRCDGKPFAGKQPRVNVHQHHQAKEGDSESDLIKSELKDGHSEHKSGVGEVGMVEEMKQRAEDEVKMEEDQVVHLDKGFEEKHLHLEELDATQQVKLRQHIQVEDQHHFPQQPHPYPGHQNLQNLIIQDLPDSCHQTQFSEQQRGYQGNTNQDWSPQKSVQENVLQGESKSEVSMQLQHISQGEDLRNSHQLFSHRPRGRRPINPNKCVTCHLCGVKISRQRDLKIHMRIHSGEKPYLCSECGEEFRQAAGLVAHNIRKHSGQRPYVCDQCGSSFPLVGSLNQHMRIHNDVKRYTCDQCGKSFLRSSDLKGHIARHLGIKKFSCHDCMKMFSTSSELTKHKTLHTGEKPHICSECRRAFRLQKSLKRHMRTHVKDRTLHCADCNKAFACAESYGEHCQSHPRGNVSIFTCSDCGAGFFDAESLLKHQHETHGWGMGMHSQ